MSKENMALWDRVSRPPESALKRIGAGRLRGMTDIKPQWRLKAITEEFGPCGEGWYTEIVETWKDDGAEGEVICSTKIKLYVRVGADTSLGASSWSAPIVGIGSSKLLELEKRGTPEERLHTNDEGWKMSETDAISVAFKKLGFGAEVYLGNWDGSKYKMQEEPDEVQEEVLASWMHLLDETDDLGGFWTKHGEAIKKEGGPKVAGLIYKELHKRLGS